MLSRASKDVKSETIVLSSEHESDEDAAVIVSQS